MLNYFSALSSCFLQKQLLCLLSVPSPTCAGPQQMHTHSHPQLAAVSQGKDSWQPNHTNWRQNHLSTRAHPAPQAPPESQDRRLQQLSRIHMESPSKETTQGLLTHTSSAEGLWENRNNSLPSEQNYSVKDKTIYFLQPKAFQNTLFYIKQYGEHQRLDVSNTCTCICM